MNSKNLYERIFLRTGIIILSVLFFIFIAPSLIDALLPIILALGLVALLAPFIKKVDEILPIKHTLVSYIVGTVLLIVVIFLLIWFIQLIVSQVSGLIGNITGNRDKIVSSTNDWIDSVNSQINLLPEFVSNAIKSGLTSIYQFLNNLQKNAVDITLGFTTAFINTSNDIIFFAITFIVAFYIILGDMEDAKIKYYSKFSERTRNNLSLIRKVFKNSTWNYIKAQLKLALLCGFIMAIALKIMGQQYFIPVALLLGFLDLLPMIGPIILLLPWSVIELFVFNNSTKGIGLLVVLVIWTALRQVIAPKVIGSSANIHPILSVIALYSGLKLFGISGAVFFPVILIFIVGIYRSGIIDNWVYDYKLFFDYIQTTLNIGKKNIDVEDEE